MDTNKRFKVKTTSGEVKEAKILGVFTNEDVEYAIYSVDNGNKTSDVYASKVILDAEGNDKLIDLDNQNEKMIVINYIREIMSN